ncbi:MAG: hypothetical protein PVJ15_03235 [Gammaproteobacteria bacterium]
MITKVILKRMIVVFFSTAMFADTGIACAFDICKNMFDKMNRSRVNQPEWRSNYRDSDDYYGDREVGPDYGYGSPAYGYGGPPVPGYAAPAYAAPQSGNEALQAEIYQLKLRLRNLENALIQENSRQQSAPVDPGTS